MENRLRRSGLAAGLVLLIVSGCGGGAPADGERVVLPEDYATREKEIMDGFKKGMKAPPGSPKKQKAQPPSTPPP